MFRFIVPAKRHLLAIPVYNETAHITAVLRESRRYIRDILVVDDGSTDSTPALLGREKLTAVIRHPNNLGYGRSLSDAFDYAVEHAYDWLVTMDCDWQHEPSFIPRFIAAAETGEADIISGSRYLETFDDSSLPPGDRREINRRITAILNDRLDLGLTDAFCGFKSYRVAALRRLHITEPGYAMPLQLWVQAWRAGLRIREIPVRLIYNDPNRHFGGELDDPHARFDHYMRVFQAELSKGKRPLSGRPATPRPCFARPCQPAGHVSDGAC